MTELGDDVLRALLESATAIVAVVNGPNGPIVHANDRLRALLGGGPLPRDERLAAAVNRVARTGRPERLRELAVAGRRFDVTLQACGGRNGDARRVALLGFDVTELARERDDLREAARGRDAFLAVLGHELRNPLAPILTAVDLLKTERDDETIERARAIVHRQARHLLRLIDDLMDVSRIARGKLQLRREPVEIGDCVRAAAEMTAPMIEARHHRLRVDVPPGLVVDGDRGRLAQVFANLLSNAARYTRSGGAIDVTGAREGDRVVVRVRDTGCGIPPEQMATLFTPFAQGDRDLARSGGGLGLGLSLVKSFVDMHGGSVSAHSEGVGRGSEFTVSLSAAAVVEAVDDGAASGSAPHPTGALRVLLVNDNADSVELLEAALSRQGFDVRTAGSGSEALAVAERFRPDVAVLDLGMPEMDGFELARRLRARPGLGDLPLLALTGYGGEQEQARAQAAGFRDYLVKPLRVKRLLGILSELRAR